MLKQIFLLNLVFIFQAFGSISESTLTNAIPDLPKVTFGGSPIYKYKVKDSTTWNQFITNLKAFIAKNSSDDKLIKSSITSLVDVANSTLNTTKNVYGSIFGLSKSITKENGALFLDYNKNLVTLQKLITALNKEIYVVPGKRSSRTVLVAYANMLKEVNQKAWGSYISATSTPQDNSKKISLYNNTKNTIELNINNSKTISIEPSKISAEFALTPTNNEFVKTILITPGAVNIGSSNIVKLPKQSVDSEYIKVINNTLKINSSVFSIITDGQKYIIKSGKDTSTPKSFQETKKDKYLLLRNKTESKLSVKIIPEKGATVDLVLSCSKLDTAIHITKLPESANIIDKKYIKKMFIQTIPLSQADIDELNATIAANQEPLFDIMYNPNKNKPLWQFFINSNPE